MRPEDLYEVWAPPDSVWSPWAKPVLFAEAGSLPGASAPAPVEAPRGDLSWVPADGETALVLDLPGETAVDLGASLARRAGFRPVPLFNGCVGPGQAMVESGAAARLLAGLAPLVSEANAALAPGAPPAFLLDSRRMAQGAKPRPGQFDNRWLVFPQDFPSGHLLLSRGLKLALVVTAVPERTPEDLIHVLLRWQRAGLRLHGLALTEPVPRPLALSTPWNFGSIFYRALAALGLHRSSVGGFGAVIPTPSASGGHGGFRGGFG